MHQLDCVCQFVIGFLTWAKRKLEENWPSSLSKTIMKMEGFSDVEWGEKSRFKKDNKFLHKRVNGTEGKEAQGRKSLNNSKA